MKSVVMLQREFVVKKGLDNDDTKSVRKDGVKSRVRSDVNRDMESAESSWWI